MAGIYIHIPFCQSRCIYCDFYSTTHHEAKEAYIKALVKELTLRAGYLQDEFSEPAGIKTIYLGGGTPSTLDASQLERIFSALYHTYRISSEAEITLEANPDDLTTEKIKELQSFPINRISIGIQTFNNRELHFLRRRHTAEQAIKAVKDCQNAGFSNISIELIYGLPEQTISQWQSNITQALQLDVPHISAYALIYEENTALWNLKEKGIISETDEDTSLTMYNMLIDELSDHHFQHYEISNFAQSGYYSRHNSSYWNSIPYLGCGPSAHSYNGKSRQWNTADLKLYIEKMQSCTQPSDFKYADWIDREYLDNQTRYNDYIMTRLRTCWGADLHFIETEFGTRLKDYCLQQASFHIKNGNLQLDKKNEQTKDSLLKLTRKGLFLSDGIISDLFSVDD